MARSSLTLAALAVAAIPDLEVASAAALNDDAEFDSAVIETKDERHLLIRVPRNRAAEDRLVKEIAAAQALTPGARARLSFAAPVLVGRARVAPTFAAVTEYPYGTAVPLAQIPIEPEGLGFAIGRAIGEIHALPSTVVTDAGLPVGGPNEARRAAESVLERVIATGLLPLAVRGRWETAIQDTDLWQFQSAVVGGGFDSSSFLSHGDVVLSVVGWQGLSIGDPASDLTWVSQNERVADAVFSGYQSIAGTGDRRLRHRAAFLSEIALGRWLLHGIETKDTDIVDDAVEMLTTLAERIHGDMSARIEQQTAPVLTVDEVEDLLDRAQKAV